MCAGEAAGEALGEARRPLNCGPESSAVAATIPAGSDNGGGIVDLARSG